MATRNLFRFVSVRPPIPAAVGDPCRLINNEAAAQFVADVSIWQQEHKESLQRARRAVSVAFIESVEYFARNDTWKDLRPERKRFQDFIAGLCRTEKAPDEDAEVKDAPPEIDSTFSQQVRRWMVDDSASYADAKNILWRSYYANALAPELRPNDRPEMLDWIRVLAALERLRPSEYDEWQYDQEDCACVRRLNTARVNMPHELFAEMPSPDPVPGKPEDAVKEPTVAIRASLERLDAAQRNLQKLYRRKVSALRLAQPAEPERGEAKTARPERGEAADGALSATGSEAAHGVRPPWLLTEEDADQLPDLRLELDRLGIPLAGSLVPEVADALDEAIAADTAALAALESRVDVLGIGPTMALAQRTVRGFLPARRGGAGSVQQTGPDGQETAR